MNVIKTNSYEGDFICAICRENFTEKDNIYLVRHFDNNLQKSEKIDKSRKRRHIFHEICISNHIDENKKSNPDGDHCCPLDREKIYGLTTIRYYDIAALNIINFSHNYYELLEKSKNKDILYVSIIDKINLNYKDINGKTLLYCVCQRGDLKLLKQLVKLGAIPTISDDNDFTPLMAAITHNYISIVKYLLKLPSVINQINYQDDRGYSAIEYADQYQKYECILEILKINGLDNQILTILLDKYQKIVFNDINYEFHHQSINEVKNKIKKYLKIPTITKSVLKKSNVPDILCNKVPQIYKRSVPRNIFNESKILYVDITKEPKFLDVIYQPPNISNHESYPHNHQYDSHSIYLPPKNL